MPRRKQADPEYTLNVFPRFEERTQTTSTVFVVQTVKEFISFRYEILIESDVEGNTISLKIRGIRTTPLTMPDVGPARGVREYLNLNGIYRLHVTKLDDDFNEFTLNISEQGITIDGMNGTSFIRVSPQPIPLS
jgi:hypothetical protein